MLAFKRACEKKARSRRKEAVAKPPRALAPRTVGEHVGGVLRIRLTRRLKNLSECGIRGLELRKTRLRVLEGAHVWCGDFKLAAYSDHVRIAKCVRLERLYRIRSWFGELPHNYVRALVS